MSGGKVPGLGLRDCSQLNFAHFFLLFSVLSLPYLIQLGFKFFRVAALPCTMKLHGPDFHLECLGTLRVGGKKEKKKLVSLAQCRKQASHRASDAESFLKALSLLPPSEVGSFYVSAPVKCMLKFSSPSQGIRFNTLPFISTFLCRDARSYRYTVMLCINGKAQK